MGEGQGEGAVGLTSAKRPLFLTFPHEGGRDPYSWQEELAQIRHHIAYQTQSQVAFERENRLWMKLHGGKW